MAITRKRKLIINANSARFQQIFSVFLLLISISISKHSEIQAKVNSPVIELRTSEQTNSKLNATQEKEKIEFLIRRIKESELCFIRNGKKYNSKEAAKHLKKKLFWIRKQPFQTKEITAEEFINEIASRSSITKEEYLVINAKGQTFTLKTWLQKELKLSCL